MMKSLDDVHTKTSDICGWDLCAFGDLERVERDQIDRGDLLAFEGGENMRVPRSREGGKG
jgi:hypothetical protein